MGSGSRRRRALRKGRSSRRCWRTSTFITCYDLWAEQWRRRHAQGAMIVVRYADDTVVGFEHRADAERFLADLRNRMAEFDLELQCADRPTIDPFAARCKSGEKWPPAAIASGARGGQAGDLQLPWVHPYLPALAAGRLLACPPHATRSDDGEAAGNHRGTSAALAPGRR